MFYRTTANSSSTMVVLTVSLCVKIQFLFSLVFSPNYSILLSTLCVASCPWTRRVSSPSPQVIARLVRTFILIPLYFILIKRKKSAVVHRVTLLRHRLTRIRCPPIRWPSLFVELLTQVNDGSLLLSMRNFLPSSYQSLSVHFRSHFQ